ncbi:TetR family transcriptional regulator [Curtobacterium flaccumfaciens]|uniref:acyl-CoA-like ligand-binding transcription factor n=1 Tax=Curtobacterium flaccumfaciens TaxID=2035 RepID=UPI003D9AA7FF
MTDEISFREQKKAAIRDALSVTTVLLARERGLDNIRVEDIVGRVGVSRRTFGNYFSSKEDAIADRHVQRVRTAADDLLQRPREEPLWTAVTEALLAPYEAEETTASREEQSGLLAVLSTPGMQSAVDRGARAANAVFAAAVAARSDAAPEDPVPGLVSAAALSTLLTTLESWAARAEPQPLQPILRAAFQLLGDGFDHLR